MGVMNADSNVRNLKIGMTQEQVIDIMGSHYEVVGANEEAIVWGYRSAYDGIYKLRFVNSKLTEWNKVWLKQYEYENNNNNTAAVKKDNSATKFHLQAHRNAMLSAATSDTEKAAINIHMDAVERSALGE